MNCKHDWKNEGDDEEVEMLARAKFQRPGRWKPNSKKYCQRDEIDVRDHSEFW